MKENKFLDQFEELIIKKESKRHEDIISKQKKIQEQKSIEEENANKRNSDNVKTYQEYIAIYEDLSQNENQIETNQNILKYIDHIEKLIILKRESIYQEDHELAHHLYLLSNKFKELYYFLERKQPLKFVKVKDDTENEEILLDNEEQDNKLTLSKKELMFLMEALRIQKVFMPNVSNTDLGKAFSMLTGFSASQLRKGLSDKMEFTAEQKDKIKSVLDKMSKALNEVSSKIK